VVVADPSPSNPAQLSLRAGSGASAWPPLAFPKAAAAEGGRERAGRRIRVPATATMPPSASTAVAIRIRLVIVMNVSWLVHSSLPCLAGTLRLGLQGGCLPRLLGVQTDARDAAAQGK
jgi:hypothetical protein